MWWGEAIASEGEYVCNSTKFIVVTRTALG